MLHFDTDYMRGACKEIIERLSASNMEQTVGYGLDDYCQRAKRLILDLCELEEGEVYFMVGGTQTNATVIDGLLAKHQGVMAAESGHISVHESGAIEASGHKVLVLPSNNGKVSAKDVERYIEDFYADESYEHMVAPGMLYISFPTELGSIYEHEELKELYAVCQKAEIPLYIDGARLGYGLMAETNKVTLQDIAKYSDVFYIGGTKVGALFGEAVVVKNKQRLKHFFSLIKQHGALLAKGRLLGMQFETLFTDNLYFKLSKNAIDRAMEIKRAFISKGYEPYSDSPTNQQFFYMSKSKIEELKQKVSFEIWGSGKGERSLVRFVTDWSTTKEDVAELISYL